MEINALIKSLRKAKKMTQAELADEVGVSRGAVARWESGEISPKTDKLVLLSKALDHDFIDVIVKNRIAESIAESNERKKESKESFLPFFDIEQIVREQELFPYSRIVEEWMLLMGYDPISTTSEYDRYWTIKDENGFVSTPVNEKELIKLFDRFIEHMKIDFQAFLEENHNGKEK